MDGSHEKKSTWCSGPIVHPPLKVVERWCLWCCWLCSTKKIYESVCITIWICNLQIDVGCGYFPVRNLCLVDVKFNVWCFLATVNLEMVVSHLSGHFFRSSQWCIFPREDHLRTSISRCLPSKRPAGRSEDVVKNWVSRCISQHENCKFTIYVFPSFVTIIHTLNRILTKCSILGKVFCSPSVSMFLFLVTLVITVDASEIPNNHPPGMYKAL